MKLTQEIKKLLYTLKTTKNKPLCEVTTFRLGGKCPLFIDNPSSDQLQKLIATLNIHEIPFIIIGQGSNLLISDKGTDRVVIRFCTDKPSVSYRDENVTVSGNTLLDDFSRICVEKNFGDISFCTGIPGTVGGAICGNAGAFGRQIGDHLVSAEILSKDGKVLNAKHDDIEFSYRNSRLKKTGKILLSATFNLPKIEKSELKAERERILDFRRTHHPDWHTTPCAGSFFKNIEATSAAERRQAVGHFLEQVGAKNMSTGGASVYEKHANIIIGSETCTANDVWNLSEKMIKAVKQKFDLDLEREVRCLGEFEE